MLNSDTVINTKGAPLSALPVGSTLHFVISFHDDIGEPFYATNSKIKFRPNRLVMVFGKGVGVGFGQGC